MKYYIGLLLSLVMFLVTNEIQSQPRRFYDRDDAPLDRLEKFKKMRLVEVLKLSEEDAVRFFAKDAAHQEKTREFIRERNSLIDDIEKIIKFKSDMQTFPKLIDQVFELDKKIFNERKRYFEEMRKFLSDEQFGKFLVFERDFEAQLRGAVKEVHRRRMK